MACFITVMLLFAPGSLVAEVPDGVSRFVARDRATNRRVIKEGVERAIESLSFLIRPFARMKLKPDRFDIATLEFRVGNGQVTIRHDSHVTTGPSSGKPVRSISAGDLIWISQKVEENRVVQVFEMENGRLELSYDFSDDARTVTIHAALRSPKLPKPLKYHLLFDRSD